MSIKLFAAVPVFLNNYLIGILAVVSIFTAIVVIMSIYKIKIVEPKYKVNKVIVVEKLENPPQDLGHRCEEMTNYGKTGCLSLGSCVWASGDGGKKQQCIAGSFEDGPDDKCFKKATTGKLNPWEEYYYLDGTEEKKKEGVSTCN